MARTESDWLWWQHGVIYQIYPRSYGDTNGDGIGDLPGIIAHIDYLHEVLGVDAIWLSPFYPSPMADFGYDVADYTDVHPMFGSLADVDRLLREAHDREIRVVIDFVPNHTSDCHPWFLESQSSRESPKRDWYVWRDAKPDGSPSNNWQGSFGGGAWEWNEATQQYYLHSFLEVEPWLPVAADADVVNVAAEIDDAHAMLTLTRALLRLRRAESALHRGDYATIPNTPPSVFAYTRSQGGRRLDTALNFGEQEVEVPLPPGGTVTLSTRLDRQDEPVTGSLTLRPHEGCVVASINQGTVERLSASAGPV